MNQDFKYKYPYFTLDEISNNSLFVDRNIALTEKLLSNSDLKHFLDERFDVAKSFYSDIAYHNKPHHMAVTNFAIIIAKKLGREDLLQGLIAAGCRHDTGYGEDHALLGFEHKEDYSIHLMRKNDISLTDEVLEIADDAIQGTKIDNTDFSTEGRKILRAADIRGLGGSFEIFEINSLNIKNEVEKLRDMTIPMDLFVDKQCEILEKFLYQSDLVPEEYFCMYGNFYDNFGGNIIKFREKYS